MNFEPEKSGGVSVIDNLPFYLCRITQRKVLWPREKDWQSPVMQDSVHSCRMSIVKRRLTGISQQAIPVTGWTRPCGICWGWIRSSSSGASFPGTRRRRAGRSGLAWTGTGENWFGRPKNRVEKLSVIDNF